MENKTLEDLVRISGENPDLVTVETTVASGLEKIAEDECFEVFGSCTPVVNERGRVYFNIPSTLINKVFSMRSVDNVYLIVHHTKCIFTSDKNEDLSVLKNKYSEISWKKSLAIWKEVYQYSGKLRPTKEEYEACHKMYCSLNGNNPKKCKVDKKRSEIPCEVTIKNPEGVEDSKHLSDNSQSNENNEEGVKNSDSMITDCHNGRDNEEAQGKENSEPNDEMIVPKFRISAKRVGSHSFTSEDLAKLYGAIIQEDFLWIVDLTDFNMEIITNITDADFIVSVSLTKSSLHRRNLTAFGLTSLRATICYGLIKLARPQAGDIVVDPLAGSGSIPIEGAAAFPKSYFFSGDHQDTACNIFKRNLDETKKSNLDLLKWDSVHLPLRCSSVDVIVTDMPFGKRSGSKKSNKVLYPGVLKEFARVLRKGSGKAVLLTADRRSLEMACSVTRNMWRLMDRRHVNVGGLKAVVFLLGRTLLD